MSNNANVWKGVVAGALGGLVASWTMDQFQSLASRIKGSGGQKSAEGSEKGQQHHSSAGSEIPTFEEPATVGAARVVSTHLFHHKLADAEKEWAGQLAHYVMGTGSGVVYGAMAERLPAAKWGGGLLFGTALWLIGDEVIVPALGFSKPASEYPASTHALAWASHSVYGLTLDVVRRAVIRLF